VPQSDAFRHYLCQLDSTTHTYPTCPMVQITCTSNKTDTCLDTRRTLRSSSNIYGDTPTTIVTRTWHSSTKTDTPWNSDILNNEKVLNNNIFQCVLIEPAGPLGAQEIESSRISGQPAHEGGEIISRMYRPPLPPGDIPDISVRGWVEPRTLVQPEELGIEPAIIRLIAQCLNELRHGTGSNQRPPESVTVSQRSFPPHKWPPHNLKNFL
jgi:hypothetical protein